MICHSKHWIICITFKQIIVKICFLAPWTILLCNRCIQFFLENEIIYAFLAFTMISRTISKIIRDQSREMMVDDTVSGRPSNETTSNTKNARITLQQTKATSPQALGTTELSNEIKAIIYDSWRTKTKTRYEGVLKKWRHHCLQQNENPYIVDIKSVLMFLHGMYKNGWLYGGICTAGSALSGAVMIESYDKLLSHPLVTTSIKGVFNKHFPLSKYVSM